MASHLDIILPCYNPIPGWEKTVVQSYQRITELLPESPIGLILVNDGSTRQVTATQLDWLQSQIPQLQIISYTENRGKGYAVRQGAAKAKAPWVIFTDIDFPYQETDLVAVYQQLQQSKADIVVGVRAGNYYENAPRYRVFISKVLKFMIRQLLRTSITDSQGGLKGFSPKGRQILLATRIDRYLFDLELVKKASRTPQITIAPQVVNLKPGVVFAPIGWRILQRELVNFIRILLLP
ncbi:MAG: glycosyltransferase family 2 protein [Lewinellaceae bacterium]|nr:glycosyltransferase family 2 protein [Lewinellaceae bacterium]